MGSRACAGGGPPSGLTVPGIRFAVSRRSFHGCLLLHAFLRSSTALDTRSSTRDRNGPAVGDRAVHAVPVSHKGARGQPARLRVPALHDGSAVSIRGAPARLSRVRRWSVATSSPSAYRPLRHVRLTRVAFKIGGGALPSHTGLPGLSSPRVGPRPSTKRTHRARHNRHREGVAVIRTCGATQAEGSGMDTTSWQLLCLSGLAGPTRVSSGVLCISPDLAPCRARVAVVARARIRSSG